MPDPEGDTRGIAETHTDGLQRHLKLIRDYLSKHGTRSLALGRGATDDINVAIIVDAHLGAFERADGRLLHIHANAYAPQTALAPRL